MPERKAGREVACRPSFFPMHMRGKAVGGAGHPPHESKTDFCAAFLGSIVTMIDASKDTLRV
jgi:hypothetical protein